MEIVEDELVDDYDLELSRDKAHLAEIEALIADASQKFKNKQLTVPELVRLYEYRNQLEEKVERKSFKEVKFTWVETESATEE